MLKERRGRFGHLSRGGILAGVVVAGCVCSLAVLLVCFGVARSDEARGVASRLPVSLAARGSRGSLARLQRQAQARAARRQRWLESPTARDQRMASQMAFHDLRGVAAQRLLARDYSSVLADVSANPAAGVAASGQVVRYIGNNVVFGACCGRFLGAGDIFSTVARCARGWWGEAGQSWAPKERCFVCGRQPFA